MLLIVALLSCSINLQAQNAQHRVSGIVSGPYGPEIGVAVILKGNTSVGTTTGADGSYQITVPSKTSVLEFSCIGYQNVEVSVAGRTVLDVTLTEDVEAVDEVVVVGYGVQKKEFVVGSVSQVEGEKLMTAPATNLSSLLSGRVTGLTTTQDYGTPGGDTASMLVRGTSTFNSSAPLCLVDGVEMSFEYVNPNDVASVTVLKDAATAAIYGVRAANGVILVTTKSGSQGKTVINYDGSFTLSQNTNMPELLNADEYIYWHNYARELDGQSPYYTEENLAWMDSMGILGDTDWIDEIYNQFGTVQQHNVSASGGTDKLKFFASIGMMDQQGILKNTDYSRYNMRANVDAKLTSNLTFSTNISGAASEYNRPGYSISNQAEYSPIVHAYYALPILTTTYEGLPLGGTNGVYIWTPSAGLTESGITTQKRWTYTSNSKLSYSFDNVDALKGLNASIFMSYNFFFLQDKGYMNQFDLYSFNPATMTISESSSMGISQNSYSKSASFGWDMTIRPQIDYNRQFGKHNVSALFLFERFKDYDDTMTGYKAGFYSDFPIDISTGMENLSPYVSGSYDYSGSASFASRIGYNYDKKYMFEFTMRADGSYKFAPENRWGYFPSVALGWVASEEGFFKSNTVDYLKVRASAGILGSDDTDAYTYMQTYYSSAPTTSIVINGSGESIYYTSGYVYNDLTWSRTYTYNLGFDLRLWKGAVGVEFDAFYKLTDRILEADSSGIYSPSLGEYYPSWTNSGSVDNRGLEFTITHTKQLKNDWYYDVMANFSWARNKVLKKKIADDHPSYRAVLGESMGTIYGYQDLGLFQTQEQVDNYPTAPSGWADLGEIMYKDVNGDGKIEEAGDYVKIGNSNTPEITYSLDLVTGWKNFRLSVLLQGAAICDYQLNGVYNNGNCDNTIFTRAFYGGGNSVKYLVEDAWTPDNTDAAYPRLRATTNSNNGWSSSYWIVSGDYLRVKNVQLSYSLPKDILDTIGIGGATIYIAGTNLLTFTEFKYLDPENPGINNGYYPVQKTYSLGVNLTF